MCPRPFQRAFREFANVRENQLNPLIRKDSFPFSRTAFLVATQCEYHSLKWLRRPPGGAPLSQFCVGLISMRLLFAWRVHFSRNGCLQVELTYMSIEDEILSLVGNGRLHEVEPTAGPWVRELFVPAELHKELEHYGEDPRIAHLRARLNVYLNGHIVVVGSGRSKRGLMKKLLKCDEVWEFIDKKPRPSLRMFCRFASPNILVGTHIVERRWLLGFNSLRWRTEQRRCVAEWRKVLPTYTPHEGDTIHDYLSNAVPARPS